MTTRVCTTREDCKLVTSLIMARELPITVKILKGKIRTSRQNRLQRLWHNEAADQLGDESAEDKRAYCKLYFGVPILRGEDEEFRDKYDRIVKPLSYEHKLEIMKDPIDFPVTRLMTTGQKKRYLDDVWHHYTGLGVKLTDPESLPDDE